jgi:hypothetical protein
LLGTEMPMLALGLLVVVQGDALARRSHTKADIDRRANV